MSHQDELSAPHLVSSLNSGKQHCVTLMKALHLAMNSSFWQLCPSWALTHHEVHVIFRSLFRLHEAPRLVSAHLGCPHLLELCENGCLFLREDVPSGNFLDVQVTVTGWYDIFNLRSAMMFTSCRLKMLEESQHRPSCCRMTLIMTQNQLKMISPLTHATGNYFFFHLFNKKGDIFLLC